MRTARTTRTAKRTNVDGDAPVSPELNTGDAAKANGKDRVPETKAQDDEQPFWEYLANLGDKWSTQGFKLYIYRTWPKVYKGESGYYLCILREPIDEDYLLRTFGSGRYLLILKGGRGKEIRKNTVALHNPEFPPRVDEAEVLSSPENATYFKVWTKKPNGNAVAVEKESMGGETNAILNTVFEKTNKFDPTLVDMWKDTATERDSLARQLAEKKVEPVPQAPAPPDVLSILTQVKALQADPLEMLEKIKSLFPAKEQGQASPDKSQRDSLDDLKNLLDVFCQAKEIFKSEPVAAVSGDADLWEKVAVNLSNQIAGIVNSVPAIITAVKFKAGAQPVAATSPLAANAAAVFDPYKHPDLAREYARSQNTATPGPSQQGPLPQDAVPGAIPGAISPGPAGPLLDAEIAQQGLALIGIALNCLNRGVDGYQCADSIIVLNGDLEYTKIVSQMQALGIPAMVELAKQLPDVAAQVTSYQDQLKRFIAEFVEGPQYEEVDERETSKAAQAHA